MCDDVSMSRVAKLNQQGKDGDILQLAWIRRPIRRYCRDRPAPASQSDTVTQYAISAPELPLSNILPFIVPNVGEIAAVSTETAASVPSSAYTSCAQAPLDYAANPSPRINENVSPVTPGAEDFLVEGFNLSTASEGQWETLERFTCSQWQKFYKLLSTASFRRALVFLRHFTQHRQKTEAFRDFLLTDFLWQLASDRDLEPNSLLEMEDIFLDIIRHTHLRHMSHKELRDFLREQNFALLGPTGPEVELFLSEAHFAYLA